VTARTLYSLPGPLTLTPSQRNRRGRFAVTNRELSDQITVAVITPDGQEVVTLDTAGDRAEWVLDDTRVIGISAATYPAAILLESTELPIGLHENLIIGNTINNPVPISVQGGGGSCAVNDPSAFFPPNNGAAAAGSGHVQYWNPVYPGGQVVVPTPGNVGGWSFPVYGSAGSPDQAGDCVGNRFRFIIGGLGVARIGINPKGHSWLVSLSHIDGTEVLDYSFSGDGPTANVLISSCSPDGYHYIDVTDSGPFCGTSMDFSGVDWTLL
jgi:hypothetical protein